MNMEYDIYLTLPGIELTTYYVCVPSAGKSHYATVYVLGTLKWEQYFSKDEWGLFIIS